MFAVFRIADSWISLESVIVAALLILFLVFSLARRPTQSPWIARALKIFGAVAVIALIGFAIQRHNFKAGVKTPRKLHFVGTVAHHAGNGLLVESAKPAVNERHDSSKLLGTFYLVGYPNYSSLPDGSALEFDATILGTTEYTTADGTTGTVRRIAYYDPAATPVSKSSD